MTGFTVSGIVRHETDMAWLIDFGDQEVWVPRSQADVVWEEPTMAGGQLIQLEIPEWLAKEKEII